MREQRGEAGMVDWDGRLRKSFQHLEDLQVAVPFVITKGIPCKATWPKLRRSQRKDMFLNGAHVFT